VTITGNSVLQLDFSESVSGVSSTSVVIKNNAGVTQPITVAGSGSSYTIDPNPDLVNGNYVLYVGESAITDVDGEGATPDRINFTVDDAVSTVAAATKAWLATTTLTATQQSDVQGAIVAAIDDYYTNNAGRDNNLLNVIPAALKAGAGRAEISTVALQQGLLETVVGTVNGAASIDGNPGRTVRLDATIEAAFALLIAEVNSALVLLVEAGTIAAADVDEMVTAFENGLAKAGADSTQKGTLLGSMQSGLTTAVNNSTVITAADKATIVANVTTSSSSSSGVTGSTLTLTSGVDNIAGTGGNDVIVATEAAHMGSLDTVTGSGGTDTLSIVAGGTTAVTFQPASLSGVEVVSLSNSNTATTTFNLLGSTGVTTARSSGSSSAPTFSNAGADLTTLEITNSGVGATVTFAATAVSGSTDNKSIKLSTMTAGDITMESVEILNIESTGSANTITTLNAAAAATINVSGDTAVTIPDNESSVVATVTSTNTAGMTVSYNDAKAMTITGGAGNDTITKSGAAVDNIAGGAGNDTIDLGSTLTNTDTVAGGDGTDELRATTAALTGYTAPTTATISGFESIRVTDNLTANLTVATVQAGITTLDLNAGSGAFTATMEAGNQNIELGAVTTGLTVSDTGTATNDNLTISNSSAATANTDVFNAQGLTVTGFETVTISSSNAANTSQDLGTVTMTADTGGTTTLNLTGSDNFTSAVITAAVINASGLTGTAQFTQNSAAASVTSITGGPNADTLLGDASSSIDGGAGSDTITGGSGNDTLVGGTGNDQITSGAGNDNIDGGAGNDTIVLAGDLGSGDTITGGDGTDKLSINNASLTTVAGLSFTASSALSSAITGVEQLVISDAFNQDTAFDVARIGSPQKIELSQWTGTEQLSGLAAASEITINGATGAGGGADDLTLTLGVATGSADALTIKLDNTSDTNFGDVTIASIENLTITTSEATASSDVDNFTLDLTATGLNSLTITGTEGLILSGVAISATTIDATGLTAGSVHVLGSGANQSMTGAAGADNLTAGAGADTLVGGGGTDWLSGGTGTDSITGGEGADTIYGGSGNDTIVLTETTAAVDSVIIDYSNLGVDKDVITGYATTSSGDRIILDLSALETAGTSGVDSTAVNFNEYKLDNSSADAAAGPSKIQVITSATTLNDAVQAIALSGATFASISDVEDAIETGGSFEIDTVGNNHFDNVQNAFLVLWSDGTNGQISAVWANTQTDNDTDFETGDLNSANLVTINGISSITSTTFDNSTIRWQN
jgi:Ca2+-binding RTX toxin-like protein